MKKLLLLVLTVALLATTTFSASAQTKVASVDMKKLFDGFWKTKQSQAALEIRKADLRKEVKDMSEDFAKGQVEYKQLLDQAADQALSADERDKRKQTAADKANELNKLKGALDQFQRQAETQLADQSQRMSSNLIVEIRKAIADKAKTGGYAMVMNSAAIEVLVFNDGSTDITDSVLTQLNAGAPIDVVKPALMPLNLSTNLP